MPSISSAAIAEGCATERAGGAKRAISAAQLASSEAGATSSEGARVCAAVLAPLHQQQRQDLDRLAEPHVVGEAGAEAEAGQQVQPAQAGLLIGPQRAVQGRARIDGGAVRSAQGFERLREPGPGGHVRPFGRFVCGLGLCDRRSRQHPQGFGERQPLPARQLFGGAEFLQRA